MPNGDRLPFGWREYKAYLQEMTRGINYPGAWDKPERKADLERMISEAESILGPNPEMAFTAGNFNLLIGLPYFADAFEYSTGTSPTSWYNLYVKTAPEEAAPAPVGVESRGGYDFLVDEAGNIISSLGRTPDVAPEELTRWQQSQLQQAQQEMAWQREQAMWGREQAMLPYQQMTAYQQAQTGLQQMQYAAQLAAMGEEGWIEQYYGGQGIGQPRQPSPPGPWYARGEGLAGIAGWTGMEPAERGDWLRQFQGGIWAGIDPTIQAQVMAGKGFPTPTGEPISYGEPLPQPKIDIKPTGEVIIMPPPVGGVQRGATVTAGRAVGVEAAGLPAMARIPSPVGAPPPMRARATAGARPEPVPLPGPPAPEWLQPFAPWVTTGQPITRGQMPTPSGQQWAGTPPSVQAGLRGFTKWGGAGRSMEDIMAHMYTMQPQAPYGGRGRWQPARQWA